MIACFQIYIMRLNYALRFAKADLKNYGRYYFEKEMSETAVWRIYAYVCHRICLFIRIFKRTGKKLIYGKHINKTL